MTTERLAFAFFALGFCLLLAIFAAYKNYKLKLNILFALYNFFNALWNTSEFFILIPVHLPRPK